jgi:hypothetical protein
LAVIFWGVISFFWHLHFLGKVFRIWTIEKLSISGFTKPVVTSFKLIWNVGIIILERVFRDIFIGISAFASKGEISTSMSVSRFYVLIITSVTWEM